MYEIEISSSGQPEPTHSRATSRNAHETYLAVLSRLSPTCVVRVSESGEQGGRAGLVMWLTQDRGRVRVHDERESYATDPAAAATGGDARVAFMEADGSLVEAPRAETITREQALVALADWLDGGEKSSLLSWS
jgi:hypothetical protein